MTAADDAAWLKRQRWETFDVGLALYENTDANETFVPFKMIEVLTGISRPVVRRACRQLARRGLAAYGKGLWSEEGGLAGAGYGITEAGDAAWKVLFDEEDAR